MHTHDRQIEAAIWKAREQEDLAALAGCAAAIAEGVEAGEFTAAELGYHMTCFLGRLRTLAAPPASRGRAATLAELERLHLLVVTRSSGAAFAPLTVKDREDIARAAGELVADVVELARGEGGQR